MKSYKYYCQEMSWLNTRKFLVAFLLVEGVSCFLICRTTRLFGRISVQELATSTKMSQSDVILSDEECDPLDPATCADFTLLVCRATSCSKKRQILQLDEFATYGALYNRRELASAQHVNIEESTCLGSCQLAPCVGVKHEDYTGTVALEGMTDNEFEKRVFHSVITDDDVDRVWGCVENAIRIMTNEESDEEDAAEYEQAKGEYV